jgi:hypothetical protein
MNHDVVDVEENVLVSKIKLFFFFLNFKKIHDESEMFYYIYELPPID